MADEAAHESFWSSRDAITRFLFLEDEPRPVDLCIVLGCPSMTNIVPAVELYLGGMTPRLLISGHGPTPESLPEWRAYRDYALARGVPGEAILIEPLASNTLENFTFSAPLVEAEIGWRNVRTVAVATKPFHTRRALMTARKHWPEHLEYVFRPSQDPNDPPAATWWRSEAGRRFVFGELAAIGTYALAGHLGGF